jgi:hypothetical protein
LLFNTKSRPYLYSRCYQPGDESILVTLWESAYARFGGYVPKTPDYWKWCVVERPGVETEDIIILEHKKRIVAYAVLAQNTGTNGNTGTILEFAVEPSLPVKSRRFITGRLVTEIEQRSRSRGDDLLDLTVPNDDVTTVNVLEQAGYRSEALDIFQLVIVDLVLLLRIILDQHIKSMPPGIESSFRLALQPGYYRYCPYQSVHIRLWPTLVIEDSESDADYKIYTDMSVISDIIFRRSDFDCALGNKKIRIEPQDGTDAVRSLFELFTINSEWYLPTVDGR